MSLISTAKPVSDLPIEIDVAELSPCALVCTAKDCRRQPGFDRLMDDLQAADIRVEAIKCLGVCSGPVVVAPIRGKLRVFHKLRDGKRTQRVIEAIVRDDHRSSKPLAPKKAKRSKAVRIAEKRLRRLISMRS